MKKRMTRKERAKQFMPFSALKGLSEALEEKEREVEEKASEDIALDIEISN